MKKITLIILIINCLFINTNSQNNCLNFDGEDDCIHSNGLYSLPSNERQTIEAWVKIDNQEEAIFASYGYTYLGIGMNSSGEFISRSYNGGAIGLAMRSLGF